MLAAVRMEPTTLRAGSEPVASRPRGRGQALTFFFES